MKLTNIFLGVLITAIALSGCDEIAVPLKPLQTNSSLPNSPPTFRDSSTNYTVYKVLVEDCMGHECDNCPPAVYAGDALIGPSSPFPGQVVLMEDNVGSFADTGKVSGAPDSAFGKDYKCVAGNYWYTEFNINGFPWGMIDRMGFLPHPNMNIGYANWQTTVQGLISQNPTPIVTINIHDSCWVPQRIIGVEFQVNFKKAQDTTCILEAVIIQDSIIDWQEDNTSSSRFDTNFVHRNVLRGSFDLSGTGTTIPVTSGTWTSYQTYDFTKGEDGRAGGTHNNPAWNMAKCYIVAFVYNSKSQMVLQAEMIKVE